MVFYRLPGGDIIEHKNRSLITTFCGPRLVLCTSPPNGGLTRHLRWVFNNDAKSAEDNFCHMYGPTMAEHMTELIRRIGLNPQFAAGLTTAADMQNAVIRELSYDNFTVTALVTAGVDKNGGRVGDTAEWHEQNGLTVAAPPPGTINIMLFINARLTDEAMLQALTTCAEAKCAVMQELICPSVYSNGIATGSGTDGTVIVAAEDSPTLLTNAGKHYKLGEAIGRVVMPALKQALFLQTDLDAEFQHNALHRMCRFGVKADDFAAYPTDVVNRLAQDDSLLTKTSLLAHLVDQINWGMLSAEEAATAAADLLKELGADCYTPKTADDIINFWQQMFKKRLDEITDTNC